MPQFSFNPTLFENRALAQEILASAGIEWLSDYAGIDIDHEFNGLEVRGIATPEIGTAILQVLTRLFPNWIYSYFFYDDKQGWMIIIQRDFGF